MVAYGHTGTGICHPSVLSSDLVRNMFAATARNRAGAGALGDVYRPAEQNMPVFIYMHGTFFLLHWQLQ
jgi:acetyl esterase/lipase